MSEILCRNFEIKRVLIIIFFKEICRTRSKTGSMEFVKNYDNGDARASLSEELRSTPTIGESLVSGVAKRGQSE
ncbi:hypothetical protein NIES208_01705 [[Limnothrix rosea] IAM M-220]|nr:hypothetical protein NIES208_01705 [[Limnothrix rosea] IAM M-220]